MPVSLKSARNYCCDGCYEPIFPGETDFSLAYVPLLQVLEMTINHGSTYLLAGPKYLEGVPQSLPTEHAEEINSFDKVRSFFIFSFTLIFSKRGGGPECFHPLRCFRCETHSVPERKRRLGVEHNFLCSVVINPTSLARIKIQRNIHSDQFGKMSSRTRASLCPLPSVNKRN